MYGVFHLLLAIRDKHGRLALLEYAVSAAVVDNISKRCGGIEHKSADVGCAAMHTQLAGGACKGHVCGVQVLYPLKLLVALEYGCERRYGGVAQHRTRRYGDTEQRRHNVGVEALQALKRNPPRLRIVRKRPVGKGDVHAIALEALRLVYCHDLHGINVVRRLYGPSVKIYVVCFHKGTHRGVGAIEVLYGKVLEGGYIGMLVKALLGTEFVTYHGVYHRHEICGVFGSDCTQLGVESIGTAVAKSHAERVGSVAAFGNVVVEARNHKRYIGVGGVFGSIAGGFVALGVRVLHKLEHTHYRAHGGRRAEQQSLRRQHLYLRVVGYDVLDRSARLLARTRKDEDVAPAVATFFVLPDDVGTHVFEHRRSVERINAFGGKHKLHIGRDVCERGTHSLHHIAVAARSNHRRELGEETVVEPYDAAGAAVIGVVGLREAPEHMAVGEVARLHYATEQFAVGVAEAVYGLLLVADD